jgi:hypothetical protein
MLHRALAPQPGRHADIPLNRRLVALEPAQAELLDRVCAGPLISADAVAAARPPVMTPEKVEGKKRRKVKVVAQGDLI